MSPDDKPSDSAPVIEKVAALIDTAKLAAMIGVQKAAGLYQRVRELPDLDRRIISALGVVAAGAEVFSGWRKVIAPEPPLPLTDVEHARMIALLDQHTKTGVLQRAERAELVELIRRHAVTTKP